MQSLLFFVVYPFAWLFSRLPMRVLYVISDILFVLIYYIFGYRKEVVLRNISRVFPEKTDLEKKELSKKFFQHFSDMLIEIVKGFSMGKNEILKRYTYKNPELLNSFVKNKKSIALVGAHQANWEWSINLPLIAETEVFGAYNQLRNPYFDATLKKSRERFGVKGIKTSEMVKEMVLNYKNTIQGIYILLSDQSPLIEKTFYWTNFFGVKVPVHTGLEMLAKKFDLVVINYHTKKIKRGYYETEFQLITENPNEFENFELTEKYLTLTEKNIRQNPEVYLWSHNRFKHEHRFEEWQKMTISKKTKN
ncbi:MAG: lysophospholipid acyltransferase family protein [Flavobacteriia bacterium]|nr:lysophospholipid acyltransferase family protein [Flavobacteriia bacterium]OIP47291.1 MAG: lipid A biosynthesis acyltransferase [Flavobacteriaceae bacterium CG2_30_31_66]PIV96127.1 MAG: lipid A biosynthesis acyltransferase [Flavobacteriaceae bacterium CG17_big_fil_post_rev_8_21_14_2_50_31_13]PIX13053.1 MAG: lipid A biosynthesis acyltransferase [Flavobacteriaceae bacterium CG_4_8_14_3_um_filter_31_8]PIY14344.1 MAG: lipid A biosynthesis acyltransferase [Flavobacteriaceae bacterium CG_4_10_14_3_